MRSAWCVAFLAALALGATPAGLAGERAPFDSASDDCTVRAIATINGFCRAAHEGWVEPGSCPDPRDPLKCPFFVVFSASGTASVPGASTLRFDVLVDSVGSNVCESFAVGESGCENAILHALALAPESCAVISLRTSIEVNLEIEAEVRDEFRYCRDAAGVPSFSHE